MREAMRAAAEGVQDRLLEHGIDLKIIATDEVGAFRADGRRVKQILFNLLSNAIGFSDEGQTVTLTALRRGNEIAFKISDQGRGIPPEILDRVFDRFESRSSGGRHRGAGLGLSIVRALVELHGGRVVIELGSRRGHDGHLLFCRRCSGNCGRVTNGRPQERREASGLARTSDRRIRNGGIRLSGRRMAETRRGFGAIRENWVRAKRSSRARFCERRRATKSLRPPVRLSRFCRVTRPPAVVSSTPTFIACGRKSSLKISVGAN